MVYFAAKPGMMILISVVLLASILSGCTPSMPMSACGIAISPEECEELRRSFGESIALSCRDGVLNEDVARSMDPVQVPGARALCREAVSAKRVDDLFYDSLADIKCHTLEYGLDDDDKAEKFLRFTFGWMTKVDDLQIEMREGLRSNCNEFRNGRISGRDVTYREAKLWREFEEASRSTTWREGWARLTLPVKIIIWIMGVVATFLGIVASLKAIFSNKQ